MPVVGRRVVVVGLAVLAASLWVTSALGASTNLSGTVTAGGTPYTKSIPVSQAGQISATISWTSPSAVLTVAVVNPSGVQVALNGTNANPKTVNFNATDTGTYKIRVKAKSGSSAFTGTVTYPGIALPTFAAQIGSGSTGHATVYPSGLDVGPDGNFANPRDLTYLNGDLYVDDTGNNRVQVLDASNGSTIGSPWTGLPSTLGITAGKDSTGNNIILVSEDTSNKIAVYSTTGTLKCTIPVPVLNGKTALPRDAATDAAGNIYVAAYQQDHVDKFPPVVGNTCPQSVNGGWGTSGQLNTQFKRPYGVAVDASGHVFVADSDNERIQEFTGTGSYLNTYGAAQPPNGGGDFFQLRRVAVANGQVYGADLWGLHIDRFTAPGPTPAQTYPAMFSAPPQGFFNEPSGMTFDNAGDLYVADSVNQRIQQFTPGADGATWSKGAMWGARGWGASDLSGFNWPRDISFAPGTGGNPGTLWVADTKNNRLLEFKTDGTSTGNSVIVGGALTWPYAVDASGGSLIVADTFANKVESWTGSTVNWSTTTANGIALKNPYDVAVAEGIVYVADAANKRIVELNANTGAYIATVGTGFLHSPQGVAIDPTNGNIWVSDTSFNKLVEFPAAGGAPIQTVSAPNGAFNQPTQLAVHVDAAGNAYLYVADVYNDRVVILNLNEGP
jgi:sugar lactone lactonase YvrE